MFETLLYIQISDTRLKISSPQIANSYESTPYMAIEDIKGRKIISAIGREAEALKGKANVNVVNPFGHPRLVVGDFTVGEKLLQHAIRELLKGKWLFPWLFGLVHPERELAGGLTQVEYRSLRELCENAGCRRVAIYEGRPLTMDELKKTHGMRT